MRALILIPVLTAAIASANPKPFDLSKALLGGYLASEHVLVSVSATDAVFTGSFTFAAREKWPGYLVLVITHIFRRLF
jgi:hypothetical protein